MSFFSFCFSFFLSFSLNRRNLSPPPRLPLIHPTLSSAIFLFQKRRRKKKSLPPQWSQWKNAKQKHIWGVYRSFLSLLSFFLSNIQKLHSFAPEQNINTSCTNSEAPVWVLKTPTYLKIGWRTTSFTTTTQKMSLYRLWQQLCLLLLALSCSQLQSQALLSFCSIIRLDKKDNKLVQKLQTSSSLSL